MMKLWTIENNSKDQIDELLSHVDNFLEFFISRKPFNKPVKIEFKSDSSNAQKIFGKTGYYDPDAFRVCVYTDGRHMKDIFRSLSHELVHHAQNCEGKFEEFQSLEQDYAQTNPILRELESEAYLFGNGLIFRDFEDGEKKKQQTALTETVSDKEWYEQILFETLTSKFT